MNIRQTIAGLLAVILLPVPAALAAQDGGGDWDPPVSGNSSAYLPPSVTTQPVTPQTVDPNLPPSVTTDPNQPPAVVVPPEPEQPPAVVVNPEPDPNLPPVVNPDPNLPPVVNAEIFTVTYVVDGVSTTETVAAGQRPAQVPALPQGFTGWRTENGTDVTPAWTEIWSNRTFTAYRSEQTPPPVTGGGNFALRTDHGAYMSGYSSGLFQPDAALTRAHVSKILYELLVNPAAGSASFTDVTGGEWYAQYVASLGSMGIINPDENGAFRGDSPITRAEFAEILSKFVPAAENVRVYPDVPEGYWAYGYIQAVTAAGLFSGNSAGAFNPEGRLTRAQAATVLNRLLGRVPDGGVIRSSPNVRIFPDVPVDYWAYEQIMEAAVSHTSEPNGLGGETWTSVNAGESPLADGFYSIDGYLYRMENGKFLRSTTAEGYTYDASGRYTTGNDELDGYLSGIIRKVTNSEQSRDQKLRAVFNYVRDNFTYLARTHVDPSSTGWEQEYALALFQRGKGNCFSFAAAYYELVRALGVDCKAIVGTVGSVREQDHGWVEVYTDGGTWIYDTELEMAYRARGDYRWNLCKITYANAPFTYKRLN